MRNKVLLIAFLSIFWSFGMFAQDNVTVEQNTDKENTEHKEAGEFDLGGTAIHHVSDANVFTILDAIRIPLPMILKSDAGWDFFSSGQFEAGHHDDGKYAYNGYVLHHGSVYRVVDPGFPMDGKVEVQGFRSEEEMVNNKARDKFFVNFGGKEYRLDARSTLDGGILGGGFTSFIDFSITKNVVSMILVSLFFIWLFFKAAKAYKMNPDKAPSGSQGILETLIVFIRDDAVIPFLGDRYKPYFPFILSLFFFILGLNFFGQIPFLGSANITGNLTVTLVLAVLVFIVTNINGNKHYWGHIFWMPGVPVPIRILLAMVEIMGLFIKPFTLMLRLAGNISAGHMAILSFVGLIFIFGESGANLGGSLIGTVVSIPVTMFMMVIEVVVAFVQAFVFAILAASYIGAATEPAHEEHVELQH